MSLSVIVLNVESFLLEELEELLENLIFWLYLFLALFFSQNFSPILIFYPPLFLLRHFVFPALLSHSVKISFPIIFVCFYLSFPSYLRYLIYSLNYSYVIFSLSLSLSFFLAFNIIFFIFHSPPLSYRYIIFPWFFISHSLLCFVGFIMVISSFKFATFSHLLTPFLVIIFSPCFIFLSFHGVFFYSLLLRFHFSYFLYSPNFLQRIFS